MLGMCCQVRFITVSVKCMVTMRWVMAWLGNGFGCSMKDERKCTIMLGRTLLLRLKTSSLNLSGNKWTTPIQPWFGTKWFSPLPTPKEVPGRQVIWRRRRPERRSVEVANITGGHILRRVYKNLCRATISASIMVANMWKNSLKDVESDNNKILYETLLNFFYSETVLTFWISLIYQIIWSRDGCSKNSRVT